MSTFEVPKFAPARPTKEDLDYIDLVNLDMAKYDNPDTRQELAQDLLKAVTEHGFLTLSNHGISQELMESQVDLAHAVMTLPPDEKAPFEATPEEDAKGRYVGFKPAGELGAKGGFHKELDHYNILTWDPEGHKHPPLLTAHLEEARETIAIIRERLLQKLLHLVAIVLEVPLEDVLKTHAFGVESTEYLRYMIYNPRTDEENTKWRDLYLAGHTDWGTFTFLFSQPVSALQILDRNGNWKWIPYIPNYLVVNVGEALELMTGGLFRATIHRVVKPPQDQAKHKRVGVIYFSRPNDDQLMRPLESPLLKRLGRDQPLDDVVYNMADYLNARKHGYKRLDFDHDKPKDEAHQDPFSGNYTDPDGFKRVYDGPQGMVSVQPKVKAIAV